MVASTHSDSLVLYPLNHIRHAVHIHRLVLIHIRVDPAAPDQAEHELVHCRPFRGFVIGRRLVVLNPVVHDSFESNVGGEQGV